MYETVIPRKREVSDCIVIGILWDSPLELPSFFTITGSDRLGEEISSRVFIESNDF